METLSTLRRATTLKLSSVELPDCFAAATVAAAVNAVERKTKSAKASRRRLVEKAYRISEVA